MGMFLLLIPSFVSGQQDSLPCNAITPWIPPLFDVVEFHDSPGGGGGGGGLACWDGDPGCIIPGANPPSNVVDNTTANMATGEILLGGSLILSVKDNTNDYSAGNFAGFVVSSELFELSLINSITIRTYLDDVIRDTYVVVDPIGLSLDLFVGPFTVGFITSLSYDEVEITISDFLGIGLYNVHYAVMERFCAGPELDCNEHTAMNSPVFPMIIDYSNTGSGGISVGVVDDPEDAISASTTDFASLINVASVLGSTFIAVEEQITDYPAGTFVGFDIENIEVVGAGILDFITVTAYLNGSMTESETGSGLLIGGTALNLGRQIVGFVTTQPVDKVKLTISQPVGVTLGTTRVYNSILREFCEGLPLDCNIQTAITMPDHPVFINGEHTGITGPACVLCDVVNSGNVIDSDPDNFAEIILAAGVGPIGSLAVKNQLIDYPAGTFAGFHLENPTLVDVNVLSGITITTYLNGTIQESETNLGALITVGSDILVNTGEQIVGIVSTMPFDEVRISMSNLVNLDLGTTLIYELVLGAFCEAEILCDTTYYWTIPDFPVYIDFNLTGVDGVACVACEIEDEQNVITASNADFATITLTANVIGSASIAVRDAIYTYPPGTFAGFVIEDESALIEADLFESLIISTYLDGDLQEFRSGVDLIDLAVVILFISAEEGRYNVGFATTLPFDEIRITAGSVVTVDPFTVLRVYSAFVDTRGSFGGDLTCCMTDAGSDLMGVCAGDTITLTGIEPNNGTWSADIGNPGGAAIIEQNNGEAEVIFGENANGSYNFIYTEVPECSDTVTVFVENCPPDAVDDEASTPENTPVVINVLANDSSPENVTATPVIIDNPLNGMVIVNGDGTVTYTPDPDFIGMDTFSYSICDQGVPVLCDTAIVVVTVTPANDPPVAVDDEATTDEDTPVSVDVLENDSDPDSPLGIPEVMDPPANGTAMVNPIDSTITYTPDPDFVGQDTFTYSICDNGMPPLCDTAEVVITVVPVIDTVIVTIPEDSMVTVCADSLTIFTEPATDISVCGPPNDGVTQITGTCITYMPDEGFTGMDTMCVMACNEDGVCDTTIVIIIVSPVNDPPVAVDDEATTDEDTPVSVDVLENDSDPDSPLGIPEVVDPPANGTAMVNPIDSTITYIPDSNFVGLDTFTYSICDNGMPPLCDTATVFITILPVIDTIEVILPYGDSMDQCAAWLTTFNIPATSIQVCDGPQHGTVVLADTCLTYYPDSGFIGMDTLCLVVCHPEIPSICDTTIVLITVLPPGCLSVRAWVYLEGSAISPTGEMQYTLPMRKTLNDYFVLPGQCFEDIFFGIKYSPPGQPYSEAPWDYMGTEGDLFDSGGDPMMGDAGYPETAVDWILVSLRDNAEGVGGPVCQAAALVHVDGRIEFVEEFDCCGVDPNALYYILIEHRNHLIVMSDEPVAVVNDTLTYDFRNQQSYINDPMQFETFVGQKEILPGVFAMLAGNGDQTFSDQADTDINFNDRTLWENHNGDIGIYRTGDYNLNADSNFNDRVVWALNNGTFTSVVRN